MQEDLEYYMQGLVKPSGVHLVTYMTLLNMLLWLVSLQCPTLNFNSYPCYLKPQNLHLKCALSFFSFVDCQACASNMRTEIFFSFFVTLRWILFLFSLKPIKIESVIAYKTYDVINFFMDKEIIIWYIRLKLRKWYGRWKDYGWTN